VKPRTLAIIQLIGALIAGYFGYSDGNWGIVVLALVFLIMAVHHFQEKKE